MAIARRNIELSGGAIAIDSRKGEGAAVSIRLPADRASAPAENPPSPA
jgi:signal transduction histidine kinase